MEIFKGIMLKKYFFLAAVFFMPQILSAVIYEITEVIESNLQSALRINNNGVISGSTIKDGQTVAFLYDSQNGELVFLSAFDSEHTYALDINNKNEIVGFSYQEEFSPTYGKFLQLVPFIFSKNKGFLSLKATLGQVNGDFESLKINDLGWLAGYGFSDSIFDSYAHKGNFRTLYSSLICQGTTGTVLNHPTDPSNFGICIKSINNKGDVAGGIFYHSGQHAQITAPAYSFIWDAVQKKMLPLAISVVQKNFIAARLI